MKKIVYEYIILKDKNKKGKRKERCTLKGGNMATREKNIWILIIFILSGLVIGGLLGQLASRS